MTSLPPFVELMASLGLDQVIKTSDQGSKPSFSSLAPTPHVASVPSHAKPKSNQSLRDVKPTRQKVARYSPYSPTQPTDRRGSPSSVSSSSSIDKSPLHSHSSSPAPSSPQVSKRSMNNLSINIYDSTPDLSVNTPISAYLRRKTPGVSPTSPTFSLERGCRSRSVSPLALTIPTLPTLYHHFPSSNSSSTLSSDSENDISLNVQEDTSRARTDRRRPRAGTRISNPTLSRDVQKKLLRSRSHAQLG